MSLVLLWLVELFYCVVFLVPVFTCFLLQVLFNIGNQYYANKNYRDALNTYLIIVKNKMFNTGGSKFEQKMN